MIYLLFEKADADALRKAGADARANGIPDDQAVLFDRAADAAAKGQVLTVAGGTMAEGDELASLFTSFGLSRPRVEVR